MITNDEIVVLITYLVGLELLMESGDPKEASYARKLAPIRKKVCNIHLCLKYYAQ